MITDLNKLDKNSFKNIIDFETEEKLKKSSQTWLIQKPQKITLTFIRNLELKDNDNTTYENDFTLTFEGYDLGTSKALYGVKIAGHLLFKSDLQQIYNNFILDLNKKLESLQKSLKEFSQERSIKEKMINKEQLEIFQKFKQNTYNYPKTLVLPINYESFKAGKDKIINLVVNMSYIQGVCIELSNGQLLFLSELYFLIQNFDNINNYLLSKFPAGEYFKI